MKTKILWQNKTWTIEKFNDYEISVRTDFTICYAYLSKDKSTLMFDRICCPKYIQKKALSLAKKYINSIYE